jgi:hypothetical protein
MKFCLDIIKKHERTRKRLKLTVCVSYQGALVVLLMIALGGPRGQVIRHARIPNLLWNGTELTLITEFEKTIRQTPGIVIPSDVVPALIFFLDNIRDEFFLQNEQIYQRLRLKAEAKREKALAEALKKESSNEVGTTDDFLSQLTSAIFRAKSGEPLGNIYFCYF